MKTIAERLADLRTAMKNAGCDAYIIPSSDPHSSEYAPEHYTSWEYFTGFRCENATFVITADEAALWIDGRFFGAADAALKDTGIKSMHMATKGVPDADDWIAEKLESGAVLGYTAENMPLSRYRSIKEKLAEGVEFRACHCDDEAWTEDRPALPDSRVWILDEKYAGLDISGKLSAFREKMGDCGGAVVTSLDSIAWLLNLRASDIECTPYALAFCYAAKDSAVLFIDECKVPADVKEVLSSAGVSIAPYDGFPAFLSAIGEETKIMTDPDSVNAALFNSIADNPNCAAFETADPIQYLKGVKNETEIACTRRAHLADAVAMVRFEMELEERLAAGETLRETDICDILLKYRGMDSLFIETSFGTIAAYGANAAMMHYAPVKGSDAEIQRKGFLLVDCGGTYYDGTTDITRTYTVGPMTETEKQMYTMVLRSHIDMAMAVWKEGQEGRQLDVIARAPVWAQLLDYRCGTGHGVGHVGAVHEGPHRLNGRSDVPFVQGMVITDEPGYYEEGVMGIRIENELVCAEAGETEYGRFLKFDPITFVPINLQPVIADELSKQELNWLNGYHAEVLEKLSPLLNEKEQAWLAAKCAPLTR